MERLPKVIYIYMCVYKYDWGRISSLSPLTWLRRSAEVRDT